LLALLELDTIVTPERDTYEHIDDVLRAFIDLAARHKCTATSNSRERDGHADCSEGLVGPELIFGARKEIENMKG